VTSLTNTSARNRARRIKLFCDQIRLYLFTRCIETDTATEYVETYMEAMMIRVLCDTLDYDLITLVKMLNDDEVMGSMWRGYTAMIDG
jgi:hypothetical protein